MEITMKLYKLPVLILFLTLSHTYANVVKSDFKVANDFKVTNHDTANYYIVEINEINGDKEHFYGRMFLLYPGNNTKIGKIPVDRKKGYYEIIIENYETGNIIYENELRVTNSTKLTCDIYDSSANCKTS